MHFLCYISWLKSWYWSKFGKFEKIVSILSARFQLENWNASARNLPSSARLEPENSSSDSSLDICCSFSTMFDSFFKLKMLTWMSVSFFIGFFALFLFYECFMMSNYVISSDKCCKSRRNILGSVEKFLSTNIFEVRPWPSYFYSDMKIT
jgi:hypothetical protein